ncbi:MAG: beta-lactamase family protein [Acidovorax sp.]|uniref:serine hydrolase domain-containing protein n=1 Tax=Acidovorax sp. TaxID=1872122 RepID=UPI0025BF4CF3|nr:serine hydrolase domain-containing protein [Acidovorax sp.]MCE1194733.1 beta-lactamase family protein [Acidovorax sp.]
MNLFISRVGRMCSVIACSIALLVTNAGCGSNAPVHENLPPCARALGYRGTLPLRSALPETDWPTDDDGSWLDRPVPPPLGALLESRLQSVLAQTGAPGATVAIGGPGLGLWQRSLGLARTAPRVVADDASLFWWASVGKAYTAVLVLQSVQQAKLSLDQPVSTWWPHFPEGRHITIAHLLNHTGGLNAAEFTAPPDAIYQPPEALVARAQANGSLFCPGAYWRYSNTGYIMLGRALELTEGMSYAELLQQHVFAPLGLTHSTVIDHAPPPVGLVTPHPGNQPVDDAARATPFAAGSIAARADDVVRFWQALLTGKLLPTSTVRASFATLYPMFNATDDHYGRGVMVKEWTDTRGRSRRWLAHQGGHPGTNALVAYDPMLHVYVAVALNSDVSAVATSNVLLQTLETWRAAAAP